MRLMMPPNATLFAKHCRITTLIPLPTMRQHATRRRKLAVLANVTKSRSLNASAAAKTKSQHKQYAGGSHATSLFYEVFEGR